MLLISQLQDAQSKVKEMGNLMKEVRAWLDEAEDFIKFLREQNDPQKESKIQEKIEVKSIFIFYLVQSTIHNKTSLSGKDTFVQATMRIQDCKRSLKRGSFLRVEHQEWKYFRAGYTRHKKYIYLRFHVKGFF